MALYRIDPERLPRFSNTIEVANQRYRFDWRWNNRTRGWYVDIFDTNGDALVLGERLSVNGRIAVGSATFRSLLMAGISDDHASWEDWADGKMVLYLLE